MEILNAIKQIPEQNLLDVFIHFDKYGLTKDNRYLVFICIPEQDRLNAFIHLVQNGLDKLDEDEIRKVFGTIPEQDRLTAFTHLNQNNLTQEEKFWFIGMMPPEHRLTAFALLNQNGLDETWIFAIFKKMPEKDRPAAIEHLDMAATGITVAQKAKIMADLASHKFIYPVCPTQEQIKQMYEKAQI